jgi:hypothetical protein
MRMRIRLTEADRLRLLCYIRPGSPGWRALTIDVVSETGAGDGDATAQLIFCNEVTAAELGNLARTHCPSACHTMEFGVIDPPNPARAQPATRPNRRIGSIA